MEEGFLKQIFSVKLKPKDTMQNSVYMIIIMFKTLLYSLASWDTCACQLGNLTVRKRDC